MRRNSRIGSAIVRMSLSTEDLAKIQKPKRRTLRSMFVNMFDLIKARGLEFLLLWY